MSRTTSVLVRCAGVLAAVVGLVYIVSLGHGRTYVVDEWQFVATRNSFTWDALVQPHGGHPVIILALFYIGVFRTVGLDHPEVFRYTVLLLHAGVAAMTTVLVRSRHGESIGIPVGVLVLLSGAGAQSILWGFQTGMVMSVLMYLIALSALMCAEREIGCRFAVLAALALLVSVMSTSVGVPAIAAVAAASFVSRSRRRLWWVALPAGTFFLVWTNLYGDTKTHGTFSSILRWITTSMSGSIAAMFNLGKWWGLVPAIVLFGVAAVQTARRRISPSGIAHMVFVITFWTMTGLGRGFANPLSSRYLNVVFPILVLLTSEVVRGKTGRNLKSTIFVSAVVLVAVATQFSGFRKEENFERTFLNGGPWMKGRLAAVELLRGHVEPEIPLARWLGFEGKQPMNVTEYLAAIDSVGDSPAYPWRSIASAPESIRRGADEFLNSSNVVKIDPVADDGCIVVDGQTSRIDLRGGGSIVIRSTGQAGVIFRRFLPDDWSVVGWRPLSKGTAMISVPSDDLSNPWSAYFDSTVETLSCTSP